MDSELKQPRESDGGGGGHRKNCVLDGSPSASFQTSRYHVGPNFYPLFAVCFFAATFFPRDSDALACHRVGVLETLSLSRLAISLSLFLTSSAGFDIHFLRLDGNLFLFTMLPNSPPFTFSHVRRVEERPKQRKRKQRTRLLVVKTHLLRDL